MPMIDHDKVWLIVPTYNEADNMELLIERVLSVLPSAHLVIVDDNSPDGTAEIVEKIAQRDKRVHLLRRSRKLGYASAVMTGLKFALSNGASILGYMDADFSHDPQELPLLVTAAQNSADIAIGSRYIAVGKIVGWAWHRKVLSRCANWLVQHLLGLPIRDSTSGFWLFRRVVSHGSQSERKV